MSYNTRLLYMIFYGSKWKEKYLAASFWVLWLWEIGGVVWGLFLIVVRYATGVLLWLEILHLIAYPALIVGLTIYHRTRKR